MEAGARPTDLACSGEPGAAGATKTILPVMSRRAAITARHATALDEVVEAVDEVARLHYHYYYCSAASA